MIFRSADPHPDPFINGHEFTDRSLRASAGPRPEWREARGATAHDRDAGFETDRVPNSSAGTLRGQQERQRVEGLRAGRRRGCDQLAQNSWVKGDCGWGADGRPETARAVRMGCGASTPAPVPIPGARPTSSGGSLRSESHRARKKSRADRYAKYPPLRARASRLRDPNEVASRPRRLAERLNRMQTHEQAAAMAEELANQLRKEQEQEQDDTPENAETADDADASLESVELIEQMMVGVTENAKAILSAERCTLWLVNPRTQMMWSFLADTDGLGTKVTTEESTDAAQAARVLRIPVGSGLTGSCAATGEVIAVQDAMADARFDSSYDEKTGFKTKACVCVPILKAPKRRTRAQKKADRLSASFKEARAKEVGGTALGTSQITMTALPCLAKGIYPLIWYFKNKSAEVAVSVRRLVLSAWCKSLIVQMEMAPLIAMQ